MTDYKKHVPKDLGDAQDLDKDEAAGEAERLRDALRFHDRRYYVEADPVISDAAYDRLFRRLQAIEERFLDLRTMDSPTQRVGAGPLKGLERVRHTASLLSLDSVLEEDAVARFVRRMQDAVEDARFVLEPKFDGVSMEVVYEDGQFVRGVTRGDGEQGDDVSRNLRTLRSLPLRLDDAPRSLALRGEVYLPQEDFQELNKRRLQRGDEPFANPRNAAAGAIRQLDPAVVAEVPLRIVCYDILVGNGVASHWDGLQQMRSWGLPTDAHNERAASMDDVRAYRERFEQERDDLPYEVDGVIVKLDDLQAREELGTRARSPRWAIAWKFPPREEETTLRDITVQVGRAGSVTPVALLDPVDVGGVTVSRASLHNADQVERLDVRPGDRVRIARAGDVIPQVVERLQSGRRRGKPFRMPGHCPSCSADLAREGAYTVCPSGLGCPAQLRGRIVHFASRSGLDIRGLGNEVAGQLVARSMVEDVADLYDLSAQDLEQLEGFATRSAKKLHDAIRSSRRPDLHRFVNALGIRHVGGRTARLLADRFGSIQAIQAATPEDIRGVAGLGDEVANAVRAFFDDPRNRRILERLHEAGLRPQAPDRRATEALEGRRFVFTGALQEFTRDEAREAVESRGGRVTTSVSGSTDFVVVGKDPGSKRKDAQEHGVQVIDEDAFRRML